MEIRKLNMLRGLAALMVLVSHYSNNTRFFNGVLGHDGGQFGVMLFFMLSGFLMAYLYINMPFQASNIKRYGIARFARVVPLFVLVVLVSYVLPKLGFGGIFYDIKDVKSLASHFLLLTGNSVLWTIPPEIQFYILFVFLWWLYSKHTGNLYAVISVVFLCLWLLNFPAPAKQLHGFEIKLKIFMALQYFFAGILFGNLYRDWQAPKKFQHHAYIMMLLILPLLYPDIFKFFTGYQHAMWREMGIFVVMCLIFFSLVFLVPENNRLLANRVGDHLGKISYSLYLLHLPVLYFFLDIAKAAPEQYFLAFIGCAVLVASLSYYLIENPARKKLRALFTQGTN